MKKKRIFTFCIKLFTFWKTIVWHKSYFCITFDACKSATVNHISVLRAGNFIFKGYRLYRWCACLYGRLKTYIFTIMMKVLISKISQK